MKHAVGLLVLVVVVGLLASGCKGSKEIGGVSEGGQPTPSPTPASSYTPGVTPWAPLSGSASAVAQRLVGVPDLQEVVGATQEALARGGISTMEGTTIITQAVGPRTSTYSLPIEAYHLAMEARHRATAGRLTLAQFGEMLRDFGWPFPPGSDPGLQLVQFLSIWVTEAQQDPENPHSFTPLFLAEMAKRQDPPVDLAAGSYSPEELRLTMLELQLFTAAFERAAVVKTARVPVSQGGGWLLVRVAHAQADPCSQFKDWLSSTYGDVTKALAEGANIALGEGVGKGLEKGVSSLGLNSETFGQGLSVLAIIARIYKLIILYSNIQVEVVVESQNPTHKPGPNEADKMAAFTARAGISQKDWEAYQQAFTSSDFVRALRDCAGVAGLPTLADIGDIAKEAATWRVEWLCVEGCPEHATPQINPDEFRHLGQLEMDLEQDPDAPYNASATIFFDITSEKAPGHTGPEKRGNVKVRAEVETSSPPTVSSLVNAIKGGQAAAAASPIGAILALADALTEVAGGWFQEMVQPKNYATLVVTYHEAGGRWTGTITFTETTHTILASEGERGGSRSESTETLTVRVTLAETEQEVADQGAIFAMVKADVSGEYTMQGTTSGWTTTVCSVLGRVRLTDSGERHMNGSGAGEGRITITVGPDGSYFIGGGSDVAFPAEGQSTGQGEICHNDGTGWKVVTITETTPLGPVLMSMNVPIFGGQIDPRLPNSLRGSKTETSRVGDSTKTTTITWDLRRN